MADSVQVLDDARKQHGRQSPTVQTRSADRLDPPVGRHAGLGQLVEEPPGVELVERLRRRSVVELGDVAPGLEGFERLGDIGGGDTGQVVGHFSRPELQREALLGCDQGVHYGHVQRGLIGNGVGEDFQTGFKGTR